MSFIGTTWSRFSPDYLMAHRFVQLVLIGFVIATSTAHFLMNEWLKDFAYRTEIQIDSFILSAVIVMVIALLTVSFQAIRVAMANPVNALQYE